MAFHREKIIREYQAAAHAGEHEYQKVMWGDGQSMTNRFQLALSEIPFQKLGNWLDVGSGTGAFQALATRQFPHIRCTAIDITPAQIEHASSRQDVGSTRFLLTDFLHFQESGFDLLTCIGVLQKTNFSHDKFFEHAHECLCSGGLIWVDTKNREWEAFLEEGNDPQPGMDWFSPQELKTAAEQAGFEKVRVQGFLTRENRVVLPEKAHTLVLTARRC